MLKKIAGTMAFLLCTVALAADLPYDDQADAHAALARALADAKDNHANVLVVFGANWCVDCRELDKAMHGQSASRIGARFVVVKISVGNFDRNIDLAQSYGNPIRKGIPAAVILAPDNSVVYATRGGELANARRMGADGIDDFFTRMAAAHP
jgi:protein disulfide-isomerase